MTARQTNGRYFHAMLALLDEEDLLSRLAIIGRGQYENQNLPHNLTFNLMLVMDMDGKPGWPSCPAARGRW